MQGEESDRSEAIGQANLDSADLDDAHRSLLDFVATLTQHACKATDEDVESLRNCGWSDEQIAETVYITATFALFNRVADAFGLDDPGY